MMDPLPDIEKAFAMFLSVEKQRSVSLVLTDSYNNHSAYHIARKEVRRHFIDKNALKRKPFVDKRTLVCAHCHKTGHSKDACFKLHGVPDWYKNLPEQKKRTVGGKNFAANVGEISGDNASTSQSTNVTSQDNITSMMAEILKLVKEQHIPTNPLTSNYANYAHFDDEFADITMFQSYTKPIHPQFISLLDGNKTSVMYTGNIQITPNITLNNDQTTKKILARGFVSKKLYVMNKDAISSLSHLSCSATQTCNEAIWHRRLGHPSKGYKLYDISSKQTFTSRDVVFHESVYPYNDSSPTLANCALPTVPLSYDTGYSHPIPQSTISADIHPPTNEPKIYADAAKYPEWRDAMTNELQALEQNHGSVERYKARLVAKEYNQIEGIDYNESFSPVAKVVTVRVFLTIAAARAWPIQQLDINNAFLHGYLDEDIYMLPPEGYHTKPGLVCKLERSFYGLKQASRQWNLEFTIKLQEYGFSQSANDHYLFTLATDLGSMFLLVYVDDILITGPSLSDIQNVKVYLHDLFSIKDLGNARYFLGLEIARNSSGTYLAQTKYTLDIIKDTGLQHAKSISTPFPSDLKLTAESGARLQHPDIFRRLVGRLLYLGFTRLDISHSVQQLSCPSQGIFLPTSNNFELSVFSDADWASCKDSRRSLTGFCVFLGSALVSWNEKQSIVSHSTAEAEYRSMAAVVCELRWISYLLTDFGVDVHTPVPLYCDNKAALHIMANSVFHERTKHIEIDCHILRNAYKDGLVLLM
ncbi:UNVERIFIED_CONTAM: Retrovirus-related Pol polyprotein from transposon RE1 [Sesamum latifolium]|uniref:Retrovirus-related Pol polyprotein from transposon RE1 n=1 Tax=Sesamum latifolium TaxID=2727402 RepID=A0AAW2WD80_9LAMI